ncbi:MAG: hypothetical protein ACYDCH_05210 [Gaiellaceae bacterium]
MAVLAMVKLSGDPEQLLAAKKQFMDTAAEAPFRAHGHQMQIVARAADGLVIFNLWESPEGRDRANLDPAMQEARARILATTGAQAEFSNWPVIEHTTTT